MDRHVPEILAPAGGPDQFMAALNSGADAVYLGLQKFNARARAENFNLDNLPRYVSLAHQFDMKVLVTLNILIKQDELDEVFDLLAKLEQIGVDAVIVQDLGVAKIIREYFPGLRMHASTQLAVHNLEGVKAASQLGFKRVVLAREITHLELKKIRDRVSRDQVQLEVFCHGSLCYSYSGLCFFSGANDARSGNRGECAYTCRQPYKVTSEPGFGFLFSMKDLDTSEGLHHLVDAGVDTLKIEGRKKDAQYVSSVVRLYRNKLDQVFGMSTLRESAPQEAVQLTTSGTEPSIRRDLGFSFQRESTSFFVKNRYHENVIDLNNPGHLGLEIGTIGTVTPDGFEFKTMEALRRFDGIKIVSTQKVSHSLPQDGTRASGGIEQARDRYHNGDLQFSLRKMKVAKKSVHEAKQGETVFVHHDGIVGRLAPGMKVFKTRSAELRERVQGLTRTPSQANGTKVRQTCRLVLSGSEEDHSVILNAQLFKGTELIGVAGDKIDRQISDNPDGSEDRAKKVLTVLGDVGMEVERLDYQLDPRFFVAPRQWKTLKRALVNSIIEGQAAKSLRQDGVTLNPVLEPKFDVKIDRLSTLDHLADFAFLHRIERVIFEPKRAWLGNEEAASLPQKLVEFADKFAIKVGLALPMVVREWDKPVLKSIFTKAASLGIIDYEVGNVGGIALIHNWINHPVNLSVDFTCYTLNTMAVAAWRDLSATRVTVSVEDDLNNITKLTKNWPSGVLPQAILYKDTPLFLAEACSLTALHNGCPTSKVCGYRDLEIESNDGETYVVAHEACKSVVYGKKAYSIAHNLKQLQSLGIQNFRLDFLTRKYDKGHLFSVLESALSGREIEATHSANFHKTLK